MRLRGTGLRGEVAGVEHGEQVAGAHVRTDIHFAAHQLASHAERERALLAGADFAGIGGQGGFGATTGVHDQHRTPGLGGLGVAVAASAVAASNAATRGTIVNFLSRRGAVPMVTSARKLMNLSVLYIYQTA